jgi:hypothetical protein
VVRRILTNYVAAQTSMKSTLWFLKHNRCEETIFNFCDFCSINLK